MCEVVLFTWCRGVEGQRGNNSSSRRPISRENRTDQVMAVWSGHRRITSTNDWISISIATTMDDPNYWIVSILGNAKCAAACISHAPLDFLFVLFVSVQYWTRRYKPSIGPFVPQTSWLHHSVLTYASWIQHTVKTYVHHHSLRHCSIRSKHIHCDFTIHTVYTYSFNNIPRYFTIQWKLICMVQSRGASYHRHTT